jgi:hypothetical protein
MRFSQSQLQAAKQKAADRARAGKRFAACVAFGLGAASGVGGTWASYQLGGDLGVPWAVQSAADHREGPPPCPAADASPTSCAPPKSTD